MSHLRRDKEATEKLGYWESGYLGKVVRGEKKGGRI